MNFLSWGDCLVPVHTYPDIFKSATFSFRIQKISTSTRNRIQIEFARPQVSDTYPNSLSYSGLFLKYWQERMRRSFLLEYSLEYSIQGKELGSILLYHCIKKYPGLASTRVLHSGERIQKVADSHAGFTGYVWTEALPGKKK